MSLRTTLLRRIHFLPVVVAGGWATYGSLFLQWRVAELFFWFWCEYVLAGISVFILMVCWSRTPGWRQRQLIAPGPWVFLFSFLMLLVFATIFAGMAYRGEWESWDRFPEFLTGKAFGLVALFAAYALAFGITVAEPEQGLAQAEGIGVQFGRKCGTILGCYVIFLIHGWIREWSGGGPLKVTPAYLQTMALALISTKTLAELGFFDRLWRCRQKRNSG